MRIGRREAVAVTVGMLLVVAAFVVPHLHLGVVTPLIHASPARLHGFADTAPIFGWWNAHAWRNACRGGRCHGSLGPPHVHGRSPWQ